MIETFDELTQRALEYSASAALFCEEWYARVQTEEHLQQLALMFLAGAVIGWFAKTLFASRKNKVRKHSSGKAGNSGFEGAKSKEEVELNARRRL